MLDEASKIWEVVRKLVGSSQEVARKFCADCYRTRSMKFVINMEGLDADLE